MNAMAISAGDWPSPPPPADYFWPPWEDYATRPRDGADADAIMLLLPRARPRPTATLRIPTTDAEPAGFTSHIAMMADFYLLFAGHA